MNIVRHKLDIIDENHPFAEREVFILHARMVGALYKMLRCHQEAQRISRTTDTLTHSDVEHLHRLREMQHKCMEFADLVHEVMYGKTVSSHNDAISWEYNFSQKDLELLGRLDNYAYAKPYHYARVGIP